MDALLARTRALPGVSHAGLINAFPFGPFHGVRVKEQVYLPDWRSAERVAFTANSAAVLAAILPDGIDGSISTVPGAFKMANASLTRANSIVWLRT